MENKKCERCGKEFSPPYRVTAAYWARRRFCSYGCSHPGMRGQRRSTFGREVISLEDRFWSKVDKRGEDECWNWTGANMFGYGYLGNRNRPNLKAHRVSYELHYGKLAEGMCVCHKCDNPSCVNPNHLFAGTKADNNADRESKGRGRHVQGEKVRSAKLNPEKVKEIRLLRETGMSQQAIANIYGVAQPTIGKIVLGKGWKSVPL